MFDAGFAFVRLNPSPKIEIDRPPPILITFSTRASSRTMLSCVREPIGSVRMRCAP